LTEVRALAACPETAVLRGYASALLPAGWSFVRDGWSGDRYHRQDSVQVGEVIGAGGEKRQSLCDGRCCDEQVGDSSARFAPGGDNRCRYTPEDAGRLGAERNRVKLTLGALQYFQAPCALGVLVVPVLVACVTSPRIPPARQAGAVELLEVLSSGRVPR
jgi:hypothetical protein